MYNNSIRNVMKKTLIVIIAAVATIACTKEANNQDNLTPEGGLLSFEATVSSFVDNETKASIAVNGSGVITGTFSWSEGDQIAFPVTGSPEYVALTYNTENGKFEGKMDNSQSIDRSRKLYYPASRVIGTPYSTDFTSIDDAKAGFKMSADVPESLSSKITLEHESALVHVQFTNMPDFADQLVVNDGSSDVATISTEGASGTINFYVPITPDGSKTYSFTLKDTAGNTIKSATKTKTLSAGNYYNTPSIAINKYIVLENASTTDNYQLGLQKRTGASYTGYEGDYSTNYSLVSLESGAKLYHILSDYFSSASAIKVVLRKNGDECTSATERIFLDRNPCFDISEDSMKTNYRVYYGGSLNTKVYQFYQPLLYLKVEMGTWSNNAWLHYWCGDDSIGSYCNNEYAKRISTDGDYSVFNVKPSLAGKTVTIQVINPGNTSDKFETSYTLSTGITKAGTYWNSGGHGIYEISGSFDFTHTNSVWPGSAPSVGGTTSLPYYEFDATLYGNNQLRVIFNNGSSGVGNQSSTWSGTLNEDGYFAS